MSNGQILGAGIGAAAGFALAGPAGAYFGTTITGGMGALYGAQIGMMAGGYLDPPKGPTQYGPRLSDLSVQTSTYGAVIPRVYGTIAVLGNIFWLENNKLKEVIKKKKSGGKGGGSSTTTKTYTYYATFAVGLCEGPIAGVRRIWIGSNLVYDAASDDLETIISSNQQSKKFAIYLGTADQLPDSRMQAEMGAANCSAYRGFAYVVVKDLALAKYGNSIQGAPVKVEVVEQATTVGFRKVLDVQSGVTYEKPYISSAQGYAVVTTSSGGNLHNSAGYYAGPTSGKILPPKAGGVYYCGHLSSGDVLSVSNIGGVFAQDDCSVELDVPITGKYLYGLTTSLNGQYILALFTPSTPITSSTNDGVFYLMDSSGAVLKTGAVGSSEAYRPVSFGRSAQYHYGASCVSNDGEYLYFAYGAGWSQVEKWEIGDSLSFVETLDSALTSGGSFTRPSIGEESGCLYIASGTGFYHVIDQEKISPSLRLVSEIVEAEASRVGLVAGVDISCELLDSYLTGYRVATVGTVRAAIEPIQGIFPFDLIQSGYMIKAVPRGQLSVATIDAGELGADEQLKQTREMDTQLPTKIVANYLDKARNYDTNQQSWERPTTLAVNTTTLDLPMVLSADQATQAIESLGNLYWLERTTFGPFTLPPTRSNLEPSDVITLSMDYADYELRLTSVNYKSDGAIECSATQNSAAVYISDAVSEEVSDDSGIEFGGNSVYRLMDIPVIDETLQNKTGFGAVMAGYLSGWSGGQLFSSADSGQTWTDLQGFAAGSLGTALTPLGSHDGSLIDQRTLTVYMLAGTLEGITRDQMLTGVNACAYGADGRWEILHFQNATLNADGSYTLSDFWRGDKGTEWATGLHLYGDAFVLLDDPDTAFISTQSSAIGSPRVYRGISNGESIDTDTDTAFTYAGVNLKPLSPVYAKATRDGSGNLSATFTRRSRLPGSWWTAGVEAVVGETSQAYEIDVMSGATVKRTIAAVTPSFSYSAADQTTDFGSAQSSITFRIYQLSESVGRGYVREVIL